MKKQETISATATAKKRVSKNTTGNNKNKANTTPASSNNSNNNLNDNEKIHTGFIGELGTIDNPIIEKAIYAGVEVFECYTKKPKGQLIMRRVRDNWINITQIFKLAKYSKAKRTRILESESKNIRHEKIQGGYGRFQGTWIALEDAKYIITKYNLENPVSKKLVEFVEDVNNPIPLREKVSSAKKQLKLSSTSTLTSSSANVFNQVSPSSYTKKLSVNTNTNTNTNTNSNNHVSNINILINDERDNAGGNASSLKDGSKAFLQTPMRTLSELQQEITTISSIKKRKIDVHSSQLMHNDEDDNCDTESDRTIQMDSATQDNISNISPYKRRKSLTLNSPLKNVETLNTSTFHNDDLNKSIMGHNNIAATKPLQFFPYPTTSSSSQKKFTQTPTSKKTILNSNNSNTDVVMMQTPNDQINNGFPNEQQHAQILNAQNINTIINSPMNAFHHNTINELPPTSLQNIISTPHIPPISVSDYQQLVLKELSSSNSNPGSSQKFSRELYFPPAGFSPNFILDGEGHTTLHWAVAMGNLPLVQFLLTTLQADPLICNSKGFNCITKACFYNNCFKNQVFMDILFCLAQCLITPDKNGRLPLHYLMELSVNLSKDQQVIKYYLDCVLQVVSTPFPSKGLSGEMVQLISTNGDGNTQQHADSGKTSKRKKKAKATNEDDNENMMLNLLPTVLNYQDKLGNTPLHVAALNMNFELCNRLIMLGGNRNIFNFENDSVDDILNRANEIMTQQKQEDESVDQIEQNEEHEQSTPSTSEKTVTENHPMMVLSPKDIVAETYNLKGNSAKYPSVYTSNTNNDNTKLQTNGPYMEEDDGLRIGMEKDNAMNNNLSHVENQDKESIGVSGDLRGTTSQGLGIAQFGNAGTMSSEINYQQGFNNNHNPTSENQQLLPPSTLVKASSTFPSKESTLLKNRTGENLQNSNIFQYVKKINTMVAKFTNQLDDVYFRRQENKHILMENIEKLDQNLSTLKNSIKKIDPDFYAVENELEFLSAKREELLKTSLSYMNYVEQMQCFKFATTIASRSEVKEEDKNNESPNGVSNQESGGKNTTKTGRYTLEEKRELMKNCIKTTIEQLRRKNEIKRLCSMKGLGDNEKLFKYSKIVNIPIHKIDSKMENIEKNLPKIKEQEDLKLSAT